LAKLEQPTSHALIAQGARIQRLEEQAQRKEPDCQETVSSLRAKVEALTEELLKAGEEISQIKRAQDAQFQRHDEELSKAEAGTQKALNSLSDKVEALTGDHLKAGQAASQTQIAQDARIQGLEEQTQRKEADSQETLSSLRAKVEALAEDLIKAGQTASQTQIAQDARLQRLEEQAQRKEAECQETLSSLRKVEALTEELVRVGRVASQTQTAQEATLRSIEERSQKSEAVTQQALSSLRDKVEELTGVHLKAGEKVKSVKRVHDVQIQGLDEKFNKAEAATQQTIRMLREAVETLRVDLDQTWSSQCKQEAMLQPTPELTQAVLPHTSYSPEETKHSPTFFYSCQDNKLHRVNLLTGEQSKHKVHHYQFKGNCRWSELPGGSLLITGGGDRDILKIDTLREYAASSQPPMHTARSHHAAVYHSQYLYVLGYSECERYVCAESRWEVLAALPVWGEGMSAFELHNSLYALGGYQGRDCLDTVQKLSLDSLTWQLMHLKLPQAASHFPCFKKDTEVYLVIATTLCSFTPLEVKPIKTFPEDIRCFSSYYSRGTLYYDLGYGIELTRL
jgi:hypothetical protein